MVSAKEPMLTVGLCRALEMIVMTKTARLSALGLSALLTLSACGGASAPGAGFIGGAPSTRASGAESLLRDSDASPADYLREAARYAQAQNDEKAALQHWGSAYAMEPGDRVTAREFARLLRLADRTDDSERVLRQALRDFPNDPELTGDLGKAQLAAGRYEEALETLGRARAMAPANVDVITAYGVALDRAGRGEEARKAYDAALAIDPTNASALNNAGLSYAISGDLESAETVLREALKAPQAGAQVRQNLAMVLSLRGDSKGAMRLARQDMPADEAEKIVAYYGSIVDQPDVWSNAAQQ